MNGELRIVRTALTWGVPAAALAAVGLAAARGPEAAVSVLIACGIVLANAGLAAAVSALAGRRGAAGAAYVAMPSFSVRMALILVALESLRARPFIDPTVFAAAFAAAVVLVMALEMRTWRRTPWIAMTMEETP